MIPSRATKPLPTPPQRTAAPALSAPKFPKPKIFAIDAPDVADHLSAAGYAAVKGTFGTPLLVERAAGYRALKLDVTLPNYTEQEIVIVDLAGPEARDAAEGDLHQPARGVKALWAPTELGWIDPRLPMMHFRRSDFDRIYDHGGVFVVFADEQVYARYLLASNDYGGLDRYESQEVRASNWDLISALNDLAVTSDHGQEIDLTDNGFAEQLGIGTFLRSATFSCTVKPHTRISNRWATLATSKYGEPVSGLLAPHPEEGGGWIFVLPRVDRRADLVQQLVEDVLPNFAPQLFPHAERQRWTRRREYELPEILAVRDEITAVEEAARTRVRELEERIEQERQRSGYQHDLLTATGDELVAAVITALQALGFDNVRDVDAEREAAGNQGPKREDLHILDADVPVLVEVKGIAGMPKESNALQVAKYLTPRMRDWERTDLKGLAIVNHQRNMPALDREHEHVFQNDVLTNAHDHGFGLLTTWDLFRLVRSYVALGWRHEQVTALFTTPGRIRPVPAHYEHIGYIDHFWEQAEAIGIRLEQGPLNAGDRVAYELPVQFVEEDVPSLQLDGQPVQSATQGTHVGVRTGLDKQQARKGVRVYRVGAARLLLDAGADAAA